jgi:hypothetical protein
LVASGGKAVEMVVVQARDENLFIVDVLACERSFHFPTVGLSQTSIHVLEEILGVCL